MKNRHYNSNIGTRGLVLGLLTLLVGACGGGGSGDGDVGGFVDTSQPVALSSGNAVPASGLVVDAAAGGLTAGSFGTVVVASAAASPTEGLDLDLVRLAPLSGMPTLSRPTTLQIPLQISLGQGNPRGTTIHDAADCRSVALAERGQGEEGTEGVSRHGALL